MKELHGIGVSSGIAMGKVHLIDRSKVKYTPRFIRDENIDSEIRRFSLAIEDSYNQLQEAQEKISEEHFQDFKHIIEAHMFILKDRMLNSETIKTIAEERVNAEWALRMVHENIVSFFKKLDDDYISERVSDVDYVVERVMRNLVGKEQESITGIKENVIIVSHDLSPADTAQIDRSVIKGFITDIGGRTSHTAIMARSLEIPAVVGLEYVSEETKSGDYIILDGKKGVVVINPTEEVKDIYNECLKRFEEEERELLLLRELPSITTDSHAVTLMANIEMPQELESVIEHGAEGIGLYRTEFLYLNRLELPSEEDHFEVYKYVVEKIQPMVTTIRTFDLGGDRFLSPVHLAKEMNPAMGLRAIRFCLRELEIFKDQLRAILRVSAYGPVRVLFPMISGVGEIRETKVILDQVKEELKKRGTPFDENIQIGSMMEIPSAMAIADLLAKEVDFFSIGTNDLIQYSLAIDRVNEHVNYLYEPLHPAVLRMIKGVVTSAKVSGVNIAICGEMAGESIYLPILLGLGLKELSMNALSILRVKNILREMSYQECKEITEKALGFSTATEIHNFVFTKMSERFPHIFGPPDQNG